MERANWGMKGRVSFHDEDDEDITTIKRKTPTDATTPKYTRPAVRRNRGVTLTSDVTPVEPIDFSEIQDRNVEIILPPEEEEEESDEEMKKKVINARQVRAQRVQEGLLEDYISLEDTTQRHLDDYDIATMIRQDSGDRRRPRQMWEDPEDEPTPGTEPVESSEEEGPLIDDSLDMEHFESHNRSSGRIGMEVEEDSKVDKSSILKMDFEDEETREWEMQQIRKGVSSAGSMSKEMRKTTRQFSQGLGAVQSEEKILIPLVSIPAIMSRVNKETAEMNLAIESCRAIIAQVEAHQTESQRSRANFDQMCIAAKEQAEFFQKLQKFIDLYSEMVEALMPLVNTLEDDWVTTLRSAGAVEESDVLERRDELLSTVDEEFSTVDGVLGRLREWKVQFGESYEKAYVDESIPGLLEMHLRVRLVGWDPLLTPGNVHDFVGFCFGSVELSDSAKNKIFTSMFVPRLINLIAASYSPLITQRSEGLVAIISYLKASLPQTSRMFTTLRGIIGNLFVEAELKTDADAKIFLHSAEIVDNVLEDDNLRSISTTKVNALMVPRDDSVETL
ncbi:hypothetical protein PSACC_00997 [Paramicrosporidium saccamoebae]|uniref:GCF C-terminal domain-containing protein n=1 Tax=Paramicrosporidium saccamoebae TaxID=1246581 RepID=A0A2H9TN50_9FUNG|nr:hypothetical protein PSACC_00997 [Paramicrosporidium saccamoebae]